MKKYNVYVLEKSEEMAVYFVTAETKEEAIQKALNFNFVEVDTEGPETVSREVKDVEVVME